MPLRNARMLAALVPALMAGVGAAQPAEDRGVLRRVLDDELTVQRVLVHEVGPQGVTVSDGGVRRRLPTGRTLAILPPEARDWPGEPDFPPPSGDPTPLAVIDLVDGQRLLARLDPAGGTGDPEALPIRTAALGALALPLERIAAVTLLPPEAEPLSLPEPPSEAPADDVLVLTNGDRLSGFVAAFGPDGVTIEADGGEVEVPIERVGAVRLANPREPAPPGRAWMRGGSIIGFDGLGGNGITLVVNPTGLSRPGETTDTPRVRLPVDEVEALALPASDGVRIVPLAALEVISSRATGDRRWAPPPEIPNAAAAPLGAAPVTLPSPMSVLFTLPAGATRFAADAGLAGFPGDHPGPWADCELVVELGETPSGPREPLFRRRLTAADPAARISVDIAPSDRPRVLVVRTEPGEHGPIQDRVRLRDAFVLVEER